MQKSILSWEECFENQKKQKNYFKLCASVKDFKNNCEIFISLFTADKG